MWFMMCFCLGSSLDFFLKNCQEFVWTCVFVVCQLFVVRLQWQDQIKGNFCTFRVSGSKQNWENLRFATNKMCKNCVSYIDKQKYLFSNNYTTLQNTYSQRWMVNVFILLLVYKWQKEMHNLCAKFLKQILNKSFVKPLVPYIWWLSVTTMSVK